MVSESLTKSTAHFGEFEDPLRTWEMKTSSSSAIEYLSRKLFKPKKLGEGLQCIRFLLKTIKAYTFCVTINENYIIFIVIL